MANFVEVYEFMIPDVDNIEDPSKNVFEDCKYKYFNSFNKWFYLYNIKFVNGKIIINVNFIVSSDDGSIRHRSARFVRHVLGDNNKSPVKLFANVSDLNLCYCLKTSLPTIF